MEVKEKLHFKIGLSGSSKQKQPAFTISIDEVEYHRSMLTQDPAVVEYFEFTADMLDGEHSINVTLLNKESSDTTQDSSGTIINDMILCIESIEIDEIDIGVLKWTVSSYFPVYPSEYNNENQKSIKEVKNCVNLGWNGTWKLPFASPFYIWLIENL